MSYYDIDAILTSSQVPSPRPPPPLPLTNRPQKLPCSFRLPLPGLGHLDPSSPPTLPAHTPLALPLWLAEPLALNSPSPTPLISLDLPPALSPPVLAALRASPQSVDIRAQAPHFFALAARLLELFEDDDQVLHVLYAAFRARASDIADHAANAGAAQRSAGGGVGVGTEGVEFLRGLDEEERKLFRVAHESAKETRRWMNEVRRG